MQHSAINLCLWVFLTTTASPLAGQVPADANAYPIATNVSCGSAPEQPVRDFRVRLSPEQERRAKTLYRRAIIITAHDHCLHADDFREQADAGITVRVVKPLTDGYYRKGAARFPIEAAVEGWEARGRAAIAIVEKQVAESRGKIIIIRTMADIERAKRERRSGVILSFEGARPLEGRLGNVAMYQRLGLRELQLFWAVPNPLKNPLGQLNDFGKDVIREMNRVGLVLDIAHMGEDSYSLALETADQPVVLSHCAVGFTEKSSSGSNTDVLDDVTIRRIAAKGGVMCLLFIDGYIRPRHATKYPTVEDLVDHVDHIRKVAGIDHVGLGPDYSPMKGWRWIQGAERMQRMPNIVRVMVQRGYTDQEIEKVLGQNLMRVYKQVWPK